MKRGGERRIWGGRSLKRNNTNVHRGLVSQRSRLDVPSYKWSFAAAPRSQGLILALFQGCRTQLDVPFVCSHFKKLFLFVQSAGIQVDTCIAGVQAPNTTSKSLRHERVSRPFSFKIGIFLHVMLLTFERGGLNCNPDVIKIALVKI